MRVLLAALLAALVIVLVSAPAFTQQPATPQAPSDRVSYMSGAEVAAVLAKGKPDIRSTNVRVFSFGPYNVNVEKRNPVAQGASSHDVVAELFHVIDGAGVIVTGGTIPNATRNGTNVSGKTIQGGARQAVTRGDWILVPSGVAHEFVDIKGNLTVMSLYLPNQK
jgi:mannose-6-phosphate isomerase-like protein (cupin superfamily)